MSTPISIGSRLALAVALAASGCAGGAPDRAVPAATEPGARAVAPSRTGFAEAKGGRIYYALFGDFTAGKTPLLVLHGSFMSGEAMAPMVAPLAESRPVITLDARGHGRTGDLPGPMSYQQMADDAAGVVKTLGVRSVDVFGYSMGGVTAIHMAIRHPDVVGKQVVVSAPAGPSGWQPDVRKGFSQWRAEVFAGTPIEAAYKRLSATPEAFPSVVDKSREREVSAVEVPATALRAIRGKTMFIVGDSDGLELAQVLRLYEARGGPDPKAGTQGFLRDAPPARLAILPATSHIGMLNEGPLIARLVAPFLDDRPPPRPSGFFEGVDASPR